MRHTCSKCKTHLIGSIAVILLVILFCQCESFALTWQTEVVESGSVGGLTDLVYTNDGNPHFFYRDFDAGTFRHAYYGPASWQTETIASRVGWTDVSADVAPNGNIYVGYVSSGVLNLAQFNGSSWSSENVAYGSISMLSVATQQSSNPCVSYWTSNIDNSLYYADYDGSSWNHQQVDTESGPGNDLLIDTLGLPHISYQYQSSGELRYAEYDGSNWDIHEFTGLDVEMTSLALDSFGNPHIAYYQAYNGSLGYAQYNGTEWLISTIFTTPSTQPTTKDLSLVLDQENHAHISFLDNTNANLMYAHFNGTTWEIETVDDLGNVGYCSSLAFNDVGLPTIVYYGYYNGNSEVRFAQAIPEPATLALMCAGIVVFSRKNRKV